jgi:ribosomal protein L24
MKLYELMKHKFNVGDTVVVNKRMEHGGEKGEVIEMSSSSGFVVVKLVGGGKHSFHESDLELVEDDDEDE